MKTVCSWCGKTITQGDDSRGVSHGMCDRCFRKFDRALRREQSQRGGSGPREREALEAELELEFVDPLLT